MLKSKLYILFFLLGVSSLKAQDQEQIAALNLYVEFLNESIHGLFTAHALLVISNKEVNKYIDLDSYSLNKLTNSEVQSNLFEKSDKANYTTFQGYSPMQLYELAKERSDVLNPSLAGQLNGLADEIAGILVRINALRFEIADFIATHDLNEKESIYGVFEILEECALMFDQYASKQRQMVEILGSRHTGQHVGLYEKARQLHRLNKAILLNMRNENSMALKGSAARFDNAFQAFDLELQDFSGYNEYEYSSYVKNRLDSITAHLERYERSDYVPKAYEIYGKYYYYHNQIAKRFFNWSGPGYVRYMNGILSELDLDFVHFTEEPLIFKVIYPMKLDELNALEGEALYTAQKKYNIHAPSVSQSTRKPARVEEAAPTPPVEKDTSYSLTISVYDHNLMDHDSISLYLNGDCILDKYNLKNGEREIEISIARNQAFVLEVKAENTGLVAPNTATVAYRFKGRRKRHRVECHLPKGQSKKITLDQSGKYPF